MTTPSGSDGPGPEPRLGPTRPATLVVAALAAAAVAWLLVSRFYGEFPQLPWLPTVTIAALAVLEGYAAMNTRARIERRPGQDPVNPLAVARLVVLAKASSLVGAIFGGFYAGLVVWLAIERTRAATNDLPAGIAGLVANLALVVAALWLERACRVPEQPGEDREPDDGPA